MPLETPDLRLEELQKQIDAQQKEIEILRSSRDSGSWKRKYLWFLLLLAGVVIVAGGMAAYGYYNVLQSIINQLPQ